MSELRRPSSLPPLCVVLTIPVVTVFWRENGLPMATTNSPGLRSADRPSINTGSFFCERKAQQGSIVKETFTSLHVQYFTIKGHIQELRVLRLLLNLLRQYLPIILPTKYSPEQDIPEQSSLTEGEMTNQQVRWAAFIDKFCFCSFFCLCMIGTRLPYSVVYNGRHCYP